MRLLLALFVCAACAGPGRVEVVRVTPVERDADAPRILAVVAHPDDETAFAGTLFKAATHLGAVCDVVVVTNGEGGFKYATLAERLYGLELTDERVGRRHLPAIRRAEMLASARLIGIRDVHFLGEHDHRYTQDLDEVLGPGAEVWDVEAVRAYLRRLMDGVGYDFVLTLVPTPATHAHHQAASLLAVEAAAALALESRPVVLAGAGRPAPGGASPPATSGGPLGALAPRAFAFDRLQGFGHRGRLNYQILVNWVIAAHRSQGTMQLAMGAGGEERFFAYVQNAARSELRAEELFRALEQPQFAPREYGESAGTNAGAR